MKSYEVFDRLVSGFLGVLFLAIAAASLWILEDYDILRAVILMASSFMSLINFKEAIAGK